MINKLKSFNILFEIFLIFLLVITIKLPYSLSGDLLIFGIIILWLNRNKLNIEKELKLIFFGFFFYFLIFSFISINFEYSFKGFYDILRAFMIFLITLVYVKKITLFKYSNYFIFMALLFSLGNFFFDRGIFYGYDLNPNNVAIESFIILMSGLIFYKSNSLLNNLLLAFLIVSSFIVIFLSNSRALILGITIGITIVIIKAVKDKKKKISYLMLMMSVLVLYFIFVNRKPIFYLSKRDELWTYLINNTVENNLFLGNGLNTTKILLSDLSYLMAHNLFIEIFVASGFIGLLIFFILIYKLFRFFISAKYNENIFYYSGLLGIVTMFITMQFDLKLASFSFLGIFLFFLALIYSQKNIR